MKSIPFLKAKLSLLPLELFRAAYLILLLEGFSWPAIAENQRVSWVPSEHRDSLCTELVGIAIQHATIVKGIEIRTTHKTLNRNLSFKDEKKLEILMEMEPLVKKDLINTMGHTTLIRTGSLGNTMSEENMEFNMKIVEGGSITILRVPRFKGETPEITIGINSKLLKDLSLDTRYVGHVFQLPIQIHASSDHQQILFSGPGSCLPIDVLEPLLYPEETLISTASYN